MRLSVAVDLIELGQELFALGLVDQRVQGAVLGLTAPPGPRSRLAARATDTSAALPSVP
jgi:hypothetical protein